MTFKHKCERKLKGEHNHCSSTSTRITPSKSTESGNSALTAGAQLSKK
jgi:hypothetical protein